MTLLAKSNDPKNNNAARTLKQHIDDCLTIFDFLKTAVPKAAEISGLGEQFWEVLKVCIICHDLGKAHNEFQNLLQDIPNKWQAQRHELFSLPFVEALTAYDKNTVSLMKLAIAGHHKHFQELQEKLSFYDNGDTFGILPTNDRISFKAAFHKNVRLKDALALLKEYAVQTDVINPKPIDGIVRSYNKLPYKAENVAYFPLMLLFGGLKWCDHLGSAMVTRLHNLSNDDFVNLQNTKHEPYYHQKRCAEVSGNLILTAPTGSGKTESAFFWLQNQFQSDGQGRVFYILPFTASINAMYERLKHVIGNEKVGMLHGKLSDYLNNYFDNLQYNVQAKKDSVQNLKEKYKSIITPLKVCTPFQLLKHLFGLNGYEQGLFELSGSYLIFDEIHAYSPETFAQIKVLLEFATERLKVKVMIMTATMPHFMRAELEACIKPLQMVWASNDLCQQFVRHKVILKDGLLSDSLEEIKLQLSQGKKVLVVCNTVKSSQLNFLQLKNSVKANEAVLLHGSFTGKDRSKKEKELMGSNTKLLVGTQAIEVSLDIDYDLIYTEPAPIDALVQRFGRVNRRREKGICECYVFIDHNKSDEYIYDSFTIKKTLSALSKIIALNGGIIDEAILQESINEVYDEWQETDREKFNEQYRYLKQALELLSPMLKKKHTEEDFYKQFDGIKILPQCNKEKYEELLETFDFISAESEKVQIRKGRFIGWMKADNIRWESFAFNKASKINIEQYLITNKKYTSDLGLISDEEDPWKTTEII